MGINPEHLLDCVISPTLDQLSMGSPEAKILLLGVAAQESRMGFYIRQLGNGPALGLYQMEPDTHDDIWNNFIRFRPALIYQLRDWYRDVFPTFENLKYNLAYATIMARLHFMRNPDPIPSPDNIEKLANYWKVHYNTKSGHGTIDEFITNYESFGLCSIWNKLKGN